MQPKKPSAVWRVLRWVLTVTGLLLLAAIFYVSVIMANPREDENPIRSDPPLASPGPGAVLESADDLQALLAGFPGPALCAAPGYGLSLTAGGIEDVPVRGGWARTLTLVYRADDGREVTLKTVWPARAAEAIDTAGWHVSAVAGQNVAGMPSVRLEKEGRLRLQCQAPAVICLVETGLASGEDLAGLLRPIRLAEPPQ